MHRNGILNPLASDQAMHCSPCLAFGLLWYGTMRFGSTSKVLAKCKLKYYRVSECMVDMPGVQVHSLLWPYVYFQDELHVYIPTWPSHNEKGCCPLLCALALLSHLSLTIQFS